MLSNRLLKDSKELTPLTVEEFNGLLGILRKTKELNNNEVFPNPNEEECKAVIDCVCRCYNTEYYKTNLEVLTALMFNICKGHYLSNGNKRITLIISLYYYVGSIDKKVSERAVRTIYKLIDRVANNDILEPTILKEEIIKKIEVS